MDQVCGTLDWTFLGSASSHSAFAGVAGGFVFAVIGIVISQRVGGRKRIAALTLFTAAFFVLVLDSFLFGVIAGEQVCMRAHTEGMVASGLLGIGAVSMIIGLAWLFEIFESNDDSSDLERFSRVVAYAAQVIVILLLAVAAFGFLSDLTATRSWDGIRPSEWMMWIYVAVTLAVLAVIAHFRPSDDQGRDRALRLATYSSLFYAITNVAIFGTTAVLPRANWEPHVDGWIVYFALVAALLFPTLTVFALVRTLPRPRAHRRSEMPLPPEKAIDARVEVRAGGNPAGRPSQST